METTPCRSKNSGSAAEMTGKGFEFGLVGNGIVEDNFGIKPGVLITPEVPTLFTRAWIINGACRFDMVRSRSFVCDSTVA